MSTLNDRIVGAVLETDIPSLEGQRVHVRPTAGNVLVERQSDERVFRGVILPFSDRISCQIARVIAVGANVKGVTAGQDAVFVRSIGRKVDDRELRSSNGKKVWLMSEDDIVATVDRDAGKLCPTRDRVLIRLPADRKEMPSGLIVMQSAETLMVVVSEVLGVGPKTSGEVQPGHHVIHHNVEPLKIDDPWLIEKFGERLGILGKETMCRAIVEYEPGEKDRIRIEGHGYASKLS